MARATGLGRGIGALIPNIDQTPAEEAVTPVVEQQDASTPPLPTVSRETEPHVSRETLSAGEPSRRPVDVFFPPTNTKKSGKVWDVAAAHGRIDLHADRKQEPEAAPLSPVPGARYAEIPINAIKANRWQPRTDFSEPEMLELINSISQIGVLQPIVVRESDHGFELIMGERRWRAAEAAGLTEIPAIIKDTEDNVMLRDALLENLHRANLNPLEEATAYRQLLDDFGCSQEELASRIARSRPQISNTLRLLKLPPLVQRRVASGVLSAGHARALLALGSEQAIEETAQHVVAEGLSVRAVEELVARKVAPPVAKTREARSIQAYRTKDLSRRLTKRFHTPVQVRMTAHGGRLAIDFSDLAELNRLLGLIAPDEEKLES